MTIFNRVKHFKPSEFDHPDKIDEISLKTLDAMRHAEGSRSGIIITINSDFATSGHSKKSQHYLGKAFDIVIRNNVTKKPLPVLSQFLIAVRWSWTGIGVYPFWDYPGIHVDTRAMTRYQRRALWMRDETGEYKDISTFFRRFQNG